MSAIAQAERIYEPFEGSFHQAAWEEANCCHCDSYGDDGDECPLMCALTFAGMGDGTINEATARAIGYTAFEQRQTMRVVGRVECDTGAPLWPCATFKGEDRRPFVAVNQIALPF